MRWVLVKDEHINTDNVRSFYWHRGILYVNFVGKTTPGGCHDPDKKEYIKLCHLLGVRPAED